MLNWKKDHTPTSERWERARRSATLRSPHSLNGAQLKLTQLFPHMFQNVQIVTTISGSETFIPKLTIHYKINQKYFKKNKTKKVNQELFLTHLLFIIVEKTLTINDSL